MNFIEIFNYAVKMARPAHSEPVAAKSLDDNFQDIGLDSLDGLLLLMYLCVIYGVSDETSKQWTPKSVREVYDLLMANKTKEPASMGEVVTACK